MKTIEEAAKEYSIKFKTQVSSEGIENIQSDFRAGAEFAQRWISVKEELPETDKKILIKFDVAATKTQNAEIGIIDTGYYIEENIFDLEQQCGLTVTHWRPIELK